MAADATIENEIHDLRLERYAAEYAFDVREKALREQLPCSPGCELCAAEQKEARRGA